MKTWNAVWTSAALFALAVAGRANAEISVVQVVQDFEGPAGHNWEQVADAPQGNAAAATKAVFRNWGGFALPVDGVPEEADGISFWVRTDDGRTAGIDVGLFEMKEVDGQYRQTEAWGNHFWATPTWQKFTFPLARMESIFAGKPDGSLQKERVRSVQFPRSLRTPGAMAAVPVLFDYVVFLKGVEHASVERLQKGHAVTIDASGPTRKIHRFWRALSPGPSGEQNAFLEGGAGEALRVIGKERTFDVIRLGWRVRRNKSGYIPYSYGKCFYTEAEDGTPRFDFKDQDAFMDAIVRELRLTPLMLMGCLPDELGQRIVYGMAMNGPPNDYEKWKLVVKTFAEHLADRYGKDAVANWYWEVWNEPDLWWHNWYEYKDGKKQTAGYESFFKLYDYAAAAVSEALPHPNIGAPAVAGYPFDYPRRLVQHCVSGKNYVTGEEGSPLQFISHHNYGTAYHQMVKLWQAQQAINELGGGRNVEIQVTEYAPSIFGQALSTRYQAASLCRTIDAYLYAAAAGAEIRWLHWFGLLRQYDVDAAAYFVCKYPKSGKYQTTTLFLWIQPEKGGPGILMAKPVYNCYRMLNHLDTNLLEVKGRQFGDMVSAIATRSDDNSRVTVLVYNHDPMDGENKGPDQRVALTIEHLPFTGTARIVNYLIDPGHSDVYAAWATEGSPPRAEITAEQVGRIKAHDGLETAGPARTVLLRAGVPLKTDITLPANSMSMFVIARQ